MQVSSGTTRKFATISSAQVEPRKDCAMASFRAEESETRSKIERRAATNFAMICDGGRARSKKRKGEKLFLS